MGDRFLGPRDPGPAREDKAEQPDGSPERRELRAAEECGADRVGQQPGLRDRQAGRCQAEADADREVEPGRPGSSKEARVDGPQYPAPVSSGGIWPTPIRRRKTQYVQPW